MFAQFRQFSAGVDQAVREVTRVTGGKTDPFNSLNVVDVVEKIREGVLAATLGCDAGQITTVGIDVLAEQGDLPVTLSGQSFHLQLDRLGPP